MLIQNITSSDSLKLITEHDSNILSFVYIGYVIVFILFVILLVRFLNRKKKPKIVTPVQVVISESSPSETIKPELDHISVQLQATPTTKKEKELISTSEIPKLKPVPQPEKEIPLIPEPVQSKAKHIGYNPLNVFEQTEPLHFPYVIMPEPGCVIKFPRKGRRGRKGYKEEEFKKYLLKFFSDAFQFFDDRFILTKTSTLPYEPDFTIIDERNGINIFIDIEIDEPYEGLNDVANRKPMHFEHSDTNRNNLFRKRGWIVIRFAEIQIHLSPLDCCSFIADVIESIHPGFKKPSSLLSCHGLNKVKQWSKKMAEDWSIQKYREKYLGIENFGLTPETNISNEEETKLGEEIEELIIDEQWISAIPSRNNTAELGTTVFFQNAINQKEYLSFMYDDKPTLIEPNKVVDGVIFGYCYIKNAKREYALPKIKNLVVKKAPFIAQAKGPDLGIEKITTIINSAIKNNRYLRIRYTRSAWTNIHFIPDTGEEIVETILSEESIRTINNVQLSIDILDQSEIDAYRFNEQYITAYCNRREAKRTFKFDRISELAILNL